MLLLLSGPSGPGRGLLVAADAAIVGAAAGVSKAASWKATASASTASMPPANRAILAGMDIVAHDLHKD